MCLSSPKPPTPPRPPQLPPPPEPPPPPAKPAPAPKLTQPVQSQPDLRIGKQKKTGTQSNRVGANTLRGTLNINSGSGGLNT